MKRSEAQAEFERAISEYEFMGGYTRALTPSLLSMIAQAANWATIAAALPEDEPEAEAVQDSSDSLMNFCYQIYTLGENSYSSWRRDAVPLIEKYKQRLEGHRGPG